MSKKRKIWISATSVGEQDQLSQIIPLLQSLEYDVYNSHNNIIDASPDNFDLDEHLNQVAKCDLFLGIINPRYIKHEIGVANIFEREIEKAIECKIPYWYLAHRDVTFTRYLFEKLECSDKNELALKKNSFFDERTIDVYKYVIENYIRTENGNSEKMITFYRLDEMTKRIDDIFKEKGNNKRLMLASTVYGFEDQLSQVVKELGNKGYNVLNSHIGSIKVNPILSNIDNCLKAVEECQIFLGIIRPFYGTGNIAGKSITFEEIKKAIELKLPIYFLVHRDVEFAEKLFRKLMCTSGEKPKLIDNRIFDIRSIELYDYVIEDNKEPELRNGNWAQEYYHPSDMMVYIMSQFSDKEFINQILNQKESKNGK